MLGEACTVDSLGKTQLDKCLAVCTHCVICRDTGCISLAACKIEAQAPNRRVLGYEIVVQALDTDERSRAVKACVTNSFVILLHFNATVLQVAAIQLFSIEVEIVFRRS